MARLVVSGGALDLLIAEDGIARTQHAKLGGHGGEIQADAVEIRVGGAMSEGGRDCVLWRVRYRLTSWIQQDGVDIGQIPEHPQEPGKLCGRSRSCRASKHFVFDTRIGAAVEDAGNKLP